MLRSSQGAYTYMWERAVAFERHREARGLKRDEEEALKKAVENGPGHEGQSKNYRAYSKGNRELWKDMHGRVQQLFPSICLPAIFLVNKTHSIENGFVAAWNRRLSQSLP